MKTSISFALAFIAVLTGIYAYLGAQHHGRPGEAVTAGVLSEINLAHGLAHRAS